MISRVLSPFFSPKWRHPKAAVRREALAGLSDDEQAIFLQVTQTDADADIRRQALQRLRGLAAVAGLLSTARGEERGTVERHLGNLLAGGLPGAAGEDERWAFVEGLGEARWFEHLLREAAEPSLRRRALERVERQALLGDVALTDTDPALRLAAAERIEQPSTLQRVARESRRHDRQVHRQVQSRLDALAAAERLPAARRGEAQRLLARQRGLHKAATRDGDWGRVADAVAALRGEWSALDLSPLGDEASALRAEWDALQADCDAALGDWRTAEAARQAANAERRARQQQAAALCTELETLRDSVRAASRVDEPATVGQVLALCTQSWAELAPVEDADLVHRYTAACAALQQALDEQPLLETANSALATLAEAVTAGLAAEGVDGAALADLEARWQALPRLQELALDAAPRQAVSDGLAQLRARVEHEQRRAADAVAQLQTLVARIEQHLREQTYTPAFALANEARQLLDGLDETQRRPLARGGVLKRLQRAQARLHEMADWQRFASAPLLERLCDSMQTLADAAEQAGSDFDIDACAARVRQARREWKQITHGQRGVPRSLWQRFDRACSRAYAPCEAHFAEENRQREAHLAAKERVCADLEAYAAKVEAEAAEARDWPALERIIKAADAAWRDIGQVPRARAKGIGRRFHRVMDRLRGLAHAYHAQNREAKAELVRQAEGLLTRLDDAGLTLPTALERCKALQAQWKAIGHAGREGELWQAFHAACDAVFARRKAERAAHDQAVQADLTQREALCAVIEAAAMASDEAFGPARQAAEEAMTAWEGKPPLPRREMARVESRFRRACEAFEGRLQSARLARREVAHQALYRRAAACEALERLADELAAGQLSAAEAAARGTDLRAALAAEAEVHGALAKSLAGRLARAEGWLQRLSADEPPHQALAGELAAERSDALARRRELCLALEIAAGVASPAEYREARMAYQVAHLAEQMKQDRQVPLAARLDALEAEWLGLPAAPVEQAAGLTARFETVLRAARALP